MSENQLSLPLEAPKNNIITLKPSTVPYWTYTSAKDGVLTIYKPAEYSDNFTIATALWLLERAKQELIKD